MTEPTPRLNTTAAMWAHLSVVGIYLVILISHFLFFGVCYWVPPVIFRHVYKDDLFVKHHATQELNATLTGLIILVASVILFLLIGPAALVLFALVGVLKIAFIIVASMKAHQGKPYRYPGYALVIQFIRDDYGEES
jgi:uncharacterized Tic20 family protein